MFGVIANGGLFAGPLFCPRLFLPCIFPQRVFLCLRSPVCLAGYRGAGHSRVE